MTSIIEFKDTLIELDAEKYLSNLICTSLKISTKNSDSIMALDLIKAGAKSAPTEKLERLLTNSATCALSALMLLIK
jgi:hypothetical protein